MRLPICRSAANSPRASVSKKIGSIEGQSAGRPTGVFLPFKGQPAQGHSGIKHMADGSYWILTDNGAGAKANSPNFMLYLNQWPQMRNTPCRCDGVGVTFHYPPYKGGPLDSGLITGGWLRAACPRKQSPHLMMGAVS